MSRAPPSVLVVEDEGLIRMATVDFLTDEGWQRSGLEDVDGQIAA